MYRESTTVLAVVLSVALALVPHSDAAQKQQASQKHLSGSLPTRGVLIPGKSLGGVTLGTSQVRVKTLWGTRYTECEKSF